MSCNTGDGTEVRLGQDDDFGLGLESLYLGETESGANVSAALGGFSICGFLAGAMGSALEGMEASAVPVLGYGVS